MATYRKVSIRIWGDEKFRSLSAATPNAQTLLFYLITGPHTSALPGMFHLGLGTLAENLGWSVRAVDRCWAEIAAAGIGEADWEARFVWLPKAVLHNPPETFNVVKSWSKAFDSLPECELKTQALQFLRTYLEGLGKGFAEAFGESGTGARTGTDQKGKPSPSNHPIRDLLSVHTVRFKQRYRSEPARYTAKECKLAKDLIARQGYARSVQLLEQFFESRDPFIARSGHSFGMFASGTVLNRIIAELAERQAAGADVRSESHLAKVAAMERAR